MALMQSLFWEPSMGILVSGVPFQRKKVYIIREVTAMKRLKDIIIN